MNEINKVVVELGSSDSTSAYFGILGTIIGSLISGAITWYFFNKSSKNQQKKEIDDKFLTQKTKSIHTSVKVMTILNEMHDMKKLLDDMISKSKNSPDFLWVAVMPISGMSDYTTTISPDDIEVPFQIGELSIANDIIRLSLRWKANHAVIKNYCQLRTEIANYIDLSKANDKGEIQLTDEDMKEIAPRGNTLNILISSIVENLNTDIDDGIKSTKILREKLNKYFCDYGGFPEIDMTVIKI
ncbi:hypothetical protein [Brucella pituitosa]|uniref:hypothetical protein n=1 Tax=Brucella pituitosa TaxID=571256 RepID=UPI0011B0D373